MIKRLTTIAIVALTLGSCESKKEKAEREAILYSLDSIKTWEECITIGLDKGLTREECDSLWAVTHSN